MIRVSVPGKVILMGDHAVVYGKPAIIAAINRRLTVSVSEGKSNTAGYVSDIIAIVQKRFKTHVLLSIEIISDICWSCSHSTYRCQKSICTITCCAYTCYTNGNIRTDRT